MMLSMLGGRMLELIERWCELNGYRLKVVYVSTLPPGRVAGARLDSEAMVCIVDVGEPPLTDTET